MHATIGRSRTARWGRTFHWVSALALAAVTAVGAIDVLNPLAPTAPAKKQAPPPRVLVSRMKNVTVRYVTDENRRLTVFYDHQHQRVTLTLPNHKKLTLPRDAAEPNKYARGTHSFWEEEGEVYYAVNEEVVYHGTPLKAKKKNVPASPPLEDEDKPEAP